MKALQETYDLLDSSITRLESLKNYRSNIETIEGIWSSFYSDVNRVDIDICNKELGPLEITRTCDLLMANLAAIKSHAQHEFALRSSLYF